MKIKIFLLGLTLTLIFTVIFAMGNTSETSPSAQINTTVKTSELSLDTSHLLIDIEQKTQNTQQNKKPKFIPEPFPVAMLSDEQCKAARRDSDRLYDEKRSYIKTEAMRAYVSGRPKEQVADAIWYELGWYDARNWYYNMLVYEAANNQLESLKTISQADALVAAVERVNRSVSQGQGFTENLNLTHELNQYLQSIPLTTLENALNANQDADTVLEVLQSTFVDVPKGVLNDAALSPIMSMISAMVALDRIDIASRILETYPSLASVDSKYDNKLRMGVLIALNQSLANYDAKDVAKKNAVEDLISMLNFNSHDFMFFEIEHWMFQNKDVKQGIEKLADMGIKLSYELTNNMEAPKPSFVIPFDSFSLTFAQEQYAKCEADKSWLASRKKTMAQWQEFAEDEFITRVKNSFEFEFCNVLASTSKSSPINQTVEEVLSIIREHLGTTELPLESINLSDLEFPNMSADVITVVSAALTEDLMQNSELSEQEIIAKLRAADFVPQPESVEVMTLLLSKNAIKLWIDSMEISPKAQSAMLLNQIAFEGKFELYQKLKGKINVEPTDMLDPLYFFIQGHSQLSINFGGKEPAFSRDNQAFITYFRENSIDIQDHHLRAMFQKKIELQSSYDALVKEFPALSEVDADNYFAVSCRQ